MVVDVSLAHLGGVRRSAGGWCALASLTAGFFHAYLPSTPAADLQSTRTTQLAEPEGPQPCKWLPPGYALIANSGTCILLSGLLKADYWSRSTRQEIFIEPTRDQREQQFAYYLGELN